MCMTFIAGKAATATGRVMVGHNEDDYQFAKVNHGYVPACEWPEGTFLPAEEGCVRVPQVSKTFGYYWMRVITPEGGFATADSFMNENGVIVVTNSSSGSKEHDEATVPPEGICYELRRIIAERAKTARHGLETAISLIKQYGYASHGRLYTIADKDEAFMLQIVRGRMYVAARVPDDAIVIMPNHYTVHTLHDVPEMFYPENIIEYAIERGWYSPAVPGDYSDFDFAKAYQNPKSYRSAGSIYRHRYGTQIMLSRPYDAEKEGYPFCVKAERPISREDMMQALSTHYEGTVHNPRYGTGCSPHFLTNIRRICTGSTLESAVYEFEERPVLTTVWTAFGRPCEVPYIPVHPLCGAVSKIGDMEAPAEEALNHFAAKPGEVAMSENGWQKFQNFANAMESVYSDEIGNVSAMKFSLSDELACQNEGNIAYAQTLSDSSAKEFLHSMDEKAAAYALNVINSVSASLFSGIKPESIKASLDDTLIETAFTCDETLLEDSLLLRFGRCQVETGAVNAVPGSLSKDGNAYKCLFRFSAPPLIKAGQGRYEFFISALTDEGKQITGMGIAEAV